MADRNENILSNLGTDFTKLLKSTVQLVLRNSLKKDSNLSDSIEFEYGRDQILMYVNDYYQSVSAGRKPNAKKIPVYAIIRWIKKNSIQSTKYSLNQLAFVIQTAIYKNGIRGKKFIDTVENSVLDVAQVKIGDNLEQVIGDSLFAAFTINK
ncbi:hypothetical protein WSM22_03410 [Cytophagales bacterium WSM2-2]|nr:hypothetical protein WSM22_03410 [Cytophagales bacterium WSM2-2]